MRVVPNFAYIVGFASCLGILDTLIPELLKRAIGDRGYAKVVGAWPGFLGLTTNRHVTLVVNLAFFSIAVAMVYNHHRTMRRIEKSNIILSAFSEVAAEAIRIESLPHADSRRTLFQRRALQALVFALETGNSAQPKVSAAVVRTESRPDRGCQKSLLMVSPTPKPLD